MLPEDEDNDTYLFFDFEMVCHSPLKPNVLAKRGRASPKGTLWGVSVTALPFPMNYNHNKNNLIKKQMKEDRKIFLESCHTQESEVKTYHKQEYFWADRRLVWLPEYLYKLNHYYKYLKSGKVCGDSSTIFQ